MDDCKTMVHLPKIKKSCITRIGSVYKIVFGGHAGLVMLVIQTRRPTFFIVVFRFLEVSKLKLFKIRPDIAETRSDEN